MDGPFCRLMKVFNSEMAPGVKLAAHTSITFMKFLVVISYTYKNVLLSELTSTQCKICSNFVLLRSSNFFEFLLSVQ